MDFRVQKAWLGISILMAAFGIFVFRRVSGSSFLSCRADENSHLEQPNNVILTIIAKSSSTLTGKRTLNLRFERTRILPLLKPKILEVPAKDVSLSGKVRQSDTVFDTRTKEEQRRRLSEMRRLDQTRILTRPFRHMSYSIWSAFQHMKQAFSMDRFIHVKIEGVNGILKLDDQGWAHDEGRTLDRLVTS